MKIQLNFQIVEYYLFYEENYYIIFERPGLQQFLTFLFKYFNVSIWTAASKDYALFIIDKIIIAGNKDRKIDYVFFSYHCGISKKIKKKAVKSYLYYGIIINYQNTMKIIL